ncbi:hypothetical protein L7750_14900 [Xenorhabdus bovienii]|nr:hypothetical protein [Xenorhabdus bovienii]MCG3471637.1 hypothetical protein [Xenorhabdus bovienii]
MVLTIFAGIAEFERTLISERNPGRSTCSEDERSRGLTLSGTKTHVRRKYLSEKSISGRACVLCVVFRFKRRHFGHDFHCP